MDLAHGEMVEAELTSADAKRTGPPGVAECHQEQAERHRAVERHQENRCYHEPQLPGG